jgi:hypothetical protein
MNRISERALTDLIPAISEAAESKEIVPKHRRTNPTACEIPDFGSLAPMMLNFGKPVWRLTKADTTWQGKVWEERSNEMHNIHHLFMKLAESLDHERR